MSHVTLWCMLSQLLHSTILRNNNVSEIIAESNITTDAAAVVPGLQPIRKTIQYGRHQLTLETGRIARQASGAVVVSMGETVLLVTVVGKAEQNDRGFFPLTVEYRQRTYAAGKIPGGFFKREGRLSETETLTSRLIDRPIRPLFPEGFNAEVQIVAQVLSLDVEINSDVPALIGAAAALTVSGLPFQGPLAAARVGYENDEYILNPSLTELETSALDLVVAGTESAVLMVESEADELSEDVMLGAVLYGHEQMQVVIEAIKDFAAQAAKPLWDWQPPAVDADLSQYVKDKVSQGLGDAYRIADKQTRCKSIEAVYQNLEQSVEQDYATFEASQLADYIAQAKKIASKVEKEIVRERVLAGEKRIDGRSHREVRPITTESSVLPRTHGSALFTRGETQALAVVTLGTARDAQIIDALEGEYKESFLLHYNFPPYCVGEVGFMGAPKRREIGHGRLAKRGVQAILPSEEEFPYVIRVVSEITESNGSSSMATVCASSLALMDAGVPIHAPVAGIAMGLVKEGNRFSVLTDILGDEDHLGDMDFKVAGTQDGVTALQMDIKIDGITKAIMRSALEQALEARLHILKQMSKGLSQPRAEMSNYAPRIYTIKIRPEQVREVIGKGGATIRAITEESGTTIDINDEGTVSIYAVDAEGGRLAKQRVSELTTEIEPGTIFDGRVVRIVDFGAFVVFREGTPAERQGLVHISQMREERVENVEDVLQEGDAVKVKVVEVDRQGRVRLTMKDLEQ